MSLPNAPPPVVFEVEFLAGPPHVWQVRIDPPLINPGPTDKTRWILRQNGTPRVYDEAEVDAFGQVNLIKLAGFPPTANFIDYLGGPPDLTDGVGILQPGTWSIPFP